MSLLVGVGVPVLVMMGALICFWVNAPGKAARRAAALADEPGFESLDRDGLARAEVTMAARVRLACVGAAFGLVLATAAVAALDLGSMAEEYGTYAMFCVLLAGAMAGGALTECMAARRSTRRIADGPRVAALSRRALSAAPGQGRRLLPLVWIAVAVGLGVVAAVRGESVLPYAAAGGAAALAMVGIGGTAIWLVRAPRHATDARDEAAQELVLRDSVARLTDHLGQIGLVTTLFAWSVASEQLGFATFAVLALIVVCAGALNAGWLRARVAAR